MLFNNKKLGFFNQYNAANSDKNLTITPPALKRTKNKSDIVSKIGTEENNKPQEFSAMITNLLTLPVIILVSQFENLKRQYDPKNHIATLAQLVVKKFDFTSTVKIEDFMFTLDLEHNCYQVDITSHNHRDYVQSGDGQLKYLKNIEHIDFVINHLSISMIPKNSKIYSILFLMQLRALCVLYTITIYPSNTPQGRALVQYIDEKLYQLDVASIYNDVPARIINFEVDLENNLTFQKCLYHMKIVVQSILYSSSIINIMANHQPDQLLVALNYEKFLWFYGNLLTATTAQIMNCTEVKKLHTEAKSLLQNPSSSEVDRKRACLLKSISQAIAQTLRWQNCGGQVRTIAEQLQLEGIESIYREYDTLLALNHAFLMVNIDNRKVVFDPWASIICDFSDFCKQSAIPEDSLFTDVMFSAH